MNDQDQEIIETWTLKKGWTELLAGLVVLVAFIGYLTYADHSMSPNFFNRWLSLLAGTIAISIGLLGLLQKRAFRRGLVYRGTQARRISLTYFIAGLVVCGVSLLVLRG